MKNALIITLVGVFCLAAGYAAGVISLTQHQMNTRPDLTTKTYPRTTETYLAFEKHHAYNYPEGESGSKLYGGGGDDKVYAAVGFGSSILLNGGADNDTFSFGPSSYWKATIEDLGDGADVVDVSYFFRDWEHMQPNIVEYEKDSIIFLDDNNIVILKDRLPDSLRPEEFLFEDGSVRDRIRHFGDIRPR